MQESIGAFTATRTCPKCGRNNKWTMRWQTTHVTDPSDPPTRELWIQTIATTVTAFGIPNEIEEVIVHTCDCGYFVVTKTKEAK